MTIGLSLNDLTQVVGQSERIAGERRFHAFLWDDGDMIDLGALGGFDGSRAGAINNSGQILGAPTYLYDPVEGMMSLYDLIPTDSRWSALSAADLNEPGQIVGVGTFRGRRHAFLMTPVAILPCGTDEADCQPNGTPDGCDVELGFSEDCNDNIVPDECESSADCQPNGIADICDTTAGTSLDCNQNEIPDECDIDDGASQDCNANGVPDDCEPDCNGNDIADDCEPDCNGNGVADDCELDFDGDGVIDDCDGCPLDADKTSPGACGCNSAASEEDDDGDGFANCIDTCPGADDAAFGPCPVDEIPTVSAWGLLLLTLLLLVTAKTHFDGHQSLASR
jgi:probable HAF family extracellular repeat protein